MEPTRIFLIRHGQTEWNRLKMYCGWHDKPLNETGKNQARLLKRKLKAEVINKIYSSDRKRAIQTAKIIFGNRHIQQVKGLREIHFGVFEGLTHKQILKKFPEAYKKWLNCPFSADIPKGENLNVFSKRVITAFNKIVSSNKSKTIAIVCHGGTISIIINKLRRTNDFWANVPRTGTITLLTIKKGKVSICQK